MEKNPEKKQIKLNKGHWTKEEHKKFIDGILTYGNEWKKIENIVKTRNSVQARSHAQKFFSKIKKDLTFNKDYINLMPNKSSMNNFYELFNQNNKDEYQLENNLSEQQKEKLWGIITKFLNDENSLNNIKDSKNEKKIKRKIFTFDKDFSIRYLKKKQYSNINPFNIYFNVEMEQNNEKSNDSF